MKITIDKEYTAGYQMAQVKEDIKEFKERYTEKDILSVIRSQLDFWNNTNAEILKTEIKAFPGGSFYGNETHFAIEMILDGFLEINKIYTYMNMDLDIPNPALSKIRTYKVN